jgi:hypothetical protein
MMAVHGGDVATQLEALRVLQGEMWKGRRAG